MERPGVRAPDRVLEKPAMATNETRTQDSTAIETDDADDTAVEIAVPETTDEPADWEAIARDSSATLLFQAASNVDETVGRVEHRLRGNANEQLTADDIRAARAALYELEQVLEENVVPAVDDVEPYERSAEHVPFGALADRLGVELDEL